ncbi:aspartate carbamoyltransferase regulatory subunit [Candidatus Woesearchaeota archaeon]|nr:MAG: aspartate carbamoyltransferase regulatory subunit [Candidatus Woesearchaeota archaeon]
MKELRVSAIKDGTVIDHIPSKSTFKVVEVLNLSKLDDAVMVAQNLKSKKMKLKGIVKVAGKELTQEEVNKIALLAPTATVNIIKNYSVRKKMNLELPEMLKGIIKCANPKCITNNDMVETKFHVRSTKPLRVQCHYCERYMTENDLEIL